MRHRHSISKQAFSLIELLVVIAIIAIIAALFFGALKSVNAKRDQVTAISNMRQIGIAFQLYAGENDGRLPNRAASNKWPKLVSAFLKDVRVYAYPGDSENYLRTTDPAKKDPVSDSANNTSFIYNGFDELGTYTDATIEILPIRFDSVSSTIMLGVPQSGDTNFFMDFAEGNEKDVLNLAAFGGGSHYLFADATARFITKEDYVKLDPATGKRIGDLLWLSDKSKTSAIK